MDALRAQFEPATNDLLQYDLANLIEELGKRAKTLQSDVSGMGDPALQPTQDAAVLGPMDELRDLGLRIAKRWIKEIQKIVCGRDAADAEDRKKIQGALGLSGSDLATAIAAYLAATFFVASPIAAAVGAIQNRPNPQQGHYRERRRPLGRPHPR